MDRHVRFLGHNIPRVLPVNFSSIFAFRIHNASSQDLYVESHASFYGTSVHDTASRIAVLLNGDFLTNVLMYGDCLHAGERTALFFPFRTGDEGDYRLEIVLAEHPDGAEGRRSLFEMPIHVSRRSSGLNLGDRMRQGWFACLYAECPIQFKKWELRSYRGRFSALRRKGIVDEKALQRLKETNRKLAFMEKQVRRLQVASLPCYLGWDTTSKCNLHCKRCFRNYMDIDLNARPDMSADTLGHLIEELFPFAFTLNLSTVGEPLLSPHMETILDACDRYRVRLSLTTNGTLLKGDLFLKKLGAVLQHIEISVDSASPELFESLRSGASYESVIQNAARLGEIRRNLPDPKFNLGFSMTLFRDNLEEIPEVLNRVAEVGGNFLKTDIGVIFSRKERDHSVLSCPDLYNQLYQTAHEKAREMGLQLWMRPPFTDDGRHEAVKVGICDYLYLSACVRPEGGLNPCYFPLLHSVSVKEGGFAAAWNSEPMQRLRRDHDTGRGHSICRDCYLVLEGSDSQENRKRQFLKGDAMKWGTLIDFSAGGNADAYKGAGWGNPEGSFTWTEGRKATLHIPIDLPTAPFVSLKARLSAFLNPGRLDKQTVHILMNGKAVGIWIFMKSEFQEKTIFIPRGFFLESNDMEITFDMPDAISPSLAGFNDDKRVLGLAVQSIELKE